MGLTAANILQQMNNDGRVAVKLLFDNNPRGFNQAFTLAGYPCNAQTTQAALECVAKLVQDKRVDNNQIAQCLTNIPVNPTPGNYTAGLEYYNALMQYVAQKP